MKITPKMEELVNKVISEIETSAKMPWDFPWFTNRLINWKSQKAYKGINVLNLSYAMSGGIIKTGQFLTFKQAQDAKGTIKKGAHGFPVCYFSPVIGKDKNGNKTTFPIMKTSIVFSIDQTEGLKPREEKKRELTPNELGEKIINLSGAVLTFGDTNRACYSPSNDTVTMPDRHLFKNDEGFYSTMFHELGHWTGHTSRLDRKLGTDYAFEELVAELTGAFLASFCGYAYDTQHSVYLAGWAKMMKDKKESLFQASSKAQKAVDFLLDKAGLLEKLEEKLEEAMPATA